MTQPQNEKPGERLGCNILRSSYMTLHPSWSKGCREMALDRWTDRHTDEAATITLVFKSLLSVRSQGVDISSLSHNF